MSNNLHLLRTSPKTLQALAGGVLGYAYLPFGPCSLLLPDDTSLEVSGVGKDIAPKFECFSLALEITEPARRSAFLPFEITRPAVVSVLLREEYTEPFTGDPSGLVGQNPITQTAAPPGFVPEHAFESCLVAYGVVIEGAKHCLAVVADWAPYKIEVVTHQEWVSDLMTLSEVVPVADYVRRFSN